MHRHRLAPADPHAVGPDRRPPPGGVVVLASHGRVWLALVVGLLVLVAAELGVRLLAADLPPPLRYADAITEHRAAMLEQTGPTDVLFAGTSMAWQAMVPSAFSDADPLGRTAFNVGLDAAVPPVTGAWLTEHVVDQVTPSTVVWGLSTLDLAPSFGEGPMRAWETSPEGRPGTLGWVERTTSEHVDLLRRRAQLRRPSLLWGEEADALRADRSAAASTTGADGERLRFDTSRSPEQAAIQRARLAGWSPDPVDIDAIVRTVLTLSAQQVDIVLVELPTPPAFAALHPRGADDVAAARRAMRTIAETLGITFLPLEGTWTDADFVDYTHLDAAGAARFSTALGTRLPGPRPAPDVLAAEDGPVPVGSPRPPATQDRPSPATGVQPAGAPLAPTPSISTPPSSAPTPGTTSPPTATAPATVPSPAGSAASPPPGPGDGTAEASPDTAPSASPPAATVATSDWIGSPGAVALAEVVRQAAVTQVGCSGRRIDPEPAASARADAAMLADRALGQAAAQTVDRAEALAASCAEETAWAAATRDLLTALERVVIPLEASLGTAATPAGSTAQAVRGATSRDLAIFGSQAHDRLRWLVDGATNPRLERNPVWWSYAQRGHVDVLLRARSAGDRIDTVVLGTSQARTGILADRVQAMTGRRTFNAGVDGATVDATRVWARRFALDVARPRRVALVVSGIDLLTSAAPPCSTGARDGIAESFDVVSQSFAGVSWLQGGPLRLSSAVDSTVPAPIRSPLDVAYREMPEQDYPQRTPEQVLRSGQTYLRAYEAFRPCPARFDDLTALLAELGERGVEVLLVSAPVRSELRAAAPPGDVERLDARLAEIAADAGARFVSYSGFLDDADMVDLVHASREGARLLSDRLAQDLGR